MEYLYSGGARLWFGEYLRVELRREGHAADGEFAELAVVDEVGLFGVQLDAGELLVFGTLPEFVHLNTGVAAAPLDADEQVAAFEEIQVDIRHALARNLDADDSRPVDLGFLERRQGEAGAG